MMNSFYKSVGMDFMKFKTLEYKDAVEAVTNLAETLKKGSTKYKGVEGIQEGRQLKVSPYNEKGKLSQGWMNKEMQKLFIEDAKSRDKQLTTLIDVMVKLTGNGLGNGK